MEVDQSIVAAVKRYDILVEIGRESCRRTELHKRVAASRSTTYRAIDSLTEHGLVTTSTGGPYGLTEQGRYLLQTIERVRDDYRSLRSAPPAFAELLCTLLDHYPTLSEFEVYPTEKDAQSGIDNYVISNTGGHIKAEFPTVPIYVLMQLASVQESETDVSVRIPQERIVDIPNKMSVILDKSGISYEYTSIDGVFGRITKQSTDTVMLTLHQPTGPVRSAVRGPKNMLQELTPEFQDGGQEAQTT